MQTRRPRVTGKTGRGHRFHPGAIVGDVTPDGKRFLLATPVGLSASAPFTVVMNWTMELKK